MESEKLSYLDTSPVITGAQTLQPNQGLDSVTDTHHQREDTSGESVRSTQETNSFVPSEDEHKGEPLSYPVTIEEGAEREGQGAEVKEPCKDSPNTGDEALCTDAQGEVKEACVEGEKADGKGERVGKEEVYGEGHRAGDEAASRETDESGEVYSEDQGAHREQQGVEENGAEKLENGSEETKEVKTGREGEDLLSGGQRTEVEADREEQGLSEVRPVMVEQGFTNEGTNKEGQEVENGGIDAQLKVGEVAGESVMGGEGLDTVMVVTSEEEQRNGNVALGGHSDQTGEVGTGTEIQVMGDVDKDTAGQVNERKLESDAKDQVTGEVKVSGEPVADTETPVLGEDQGVGGLGAEAQEVGSNAPLTEEVTGKDAEVSEEGIAAYAQVTREVTSPDVQGTVHGIGAQVTGEGTGPDVQGIVDGIGAGVQVTARIGAGELTEAGTSVQVCAERSGVYVTGADKQVRNSDERAEQQAPGELIHIQSEEVTGVQECVSDSEVQSQERGEEGASGQVSASGKEAGKKVTPDPAIDREGTAEPDRPAACWEEEGPPLMYNEREVRADIAGQGETQQGTVTEQDLSSTIPEMKDRESMVESPLPETPIEREIRLLMEREQDLRQERGINLPVGQQELVEVRRKAVTAEQGSPTDKERQFAGAQMQRDIQLETRREQDLVQQGKVMGAYDRGQQQEVQEKKMIFESLVTVSSDSPSKKRQSASPQDESDGNGTSTAPVYVDSAVSNHVAPSSGGKKGPSYAEANGSNVILIEHSSLLRRSVHNESSGSAYANPLRSVSANPPSPAAEDSPRVAPGSPFLQLRSPSPRSLLDKEIEEANEREKELRRQRSSLYGKADGPLEAKEPETRGDIQSSTYQPERPSWRKLEVNWPPNKDVAMNGQQPEQVKDSTRTRRQKNTLIQSWESGTLNPRDEE
ncbi:uncharacterized protein MISP3 [Discoglossus pictus]